VIRAPDCVGDLQQLASVFDEIWGTTCPVVRVELLRAVQHAGGYLSVAEDGDRFVGGSFGVLGHHAGEPALHSHVTGVLPSVRHTGLGRALKLHQRAWAADEGLAWIVWTFDPLVRRNAWFNLSVLGARVDEYLVDFYGPIDDAVNANDETDRVLVAWPVGDAPAAAAAPSAALTAVPTPDDIVELRRTDPAAAAAWRKRLRTELGDRLADGGRVVGFSRDGDYVVAS
jgi:predicted GNAT superfamily acetyltransferase